MQTGAQVGGDAGYVYKCANLVGRVKRGEEALCSEIEKQLSDMKNDGTIEEISKKWFGSDITTIK